MGTKKLKKKINSLEKGIGNSEDEALDLEKELFSLTHYVDDEEELITQLFSIIKGVKLEAMLPPILKEIPLFDLQNLCLHELRGMSSRRILSIINGQEMSGSSSEGSGNSDDSDSAAGKKSKAKVTKGKGGKDSELTALDLLELEMRAKLIKNMLDKEPSDEDPSAGIQIKEEPLSPSQIKKERIDDYQNGNILNEKSTRSNSRSSYSSYSTRTYTSSESSRSKSRSSSRGRHRPSKKKLSRREFEERMRKAKINRKYRSRRRSEDSDYDKRSRRRTRKQGSRREESPPEKEADMEDQPMEQQNEESMPLESEERRIEEACPLPEGDEMTENVDESKVDAEKEEDWELNLEEKQVGDAEMEDKTKEEGMADIMEGELGEEMEEGEENMIGEGEDKLAPAEVKEPQVEKEEGEASDSSGNHSPVKPKSKTVTKKKKNRSRSRSRSRSFSSFSSSYDSYDSFTMSNSYSSSRSRSNSRKRSSRRNKKKKKYSRRSSYSRSSSRSESPRTPSPSIKKIKKIQKKKPSLPFGIIAIADKAAVKEKEVKKSQDTKVESWGQSVDIEFLNSDEENGQKKVDSKDGTGPKGDEPPVLQSFPRKRLIQKEERPSITFAFNKVAAPIVPNVEMQDEAIPIKEYPIANDGNESDSSSEDDTEPDPSLSDIDGVPLQECASSINLKPKTVKDDSPLRKSVSPQIPSSDLINSSEPNDSPMPDISNIAADTPVEVYTTDEGAAYVGDYILPGQDKQNTNEGDVSVEETTMPQTAIKIDDDDDVQIVDMIDVPQPVVEELTLPDDEFGYAEEYYEQYDEKQVTEGSHHHKKSKKSKKSKSKRRRSSRHRKEEGECEDEEEQMNKMVDLSLTDPAFVEGRMEEGEIDSAEETNTEPNPQSVHTDPISPDEMGDYPFAQNPVSQNIDNSPLVDLPESLHTDLISPEVMNDSSLPDSFGYRDSPLEDINSESQQSLPPRKQPEIIGTLELADGSETFENVDNQGSSWNTRWLQSEKVQKVVSNSKMLSKVRKKIQMKGKILDRKAKIAQLPNPIQDENPDSQFDRAYQSSRVGKMYQASKIAQVQQKSHIKHLPMQVNLHPQSVLQGAFQTQESAQAPVQPQPSYAQIQPDHTHSLSDANAPTSVTIKQSSSTSSSSAPIIGSVEEYQRLFNEDGSAKSTPAPAPEEKGARSGKSILLDSDDDDSDDELWSKILK